MQVLQVKLTSVFTLCRDVGAHTLQQTPSRSGKRGSIINVASLLSFQDGFTVPVYAASKGGVAQLTKALLNEWAGKGICVNGIAPGYIGSYRDDHGIDGRRGTSKEHPSTHSVGRWGRPADVKGPVVFLAGEASRYVSGEIMVVNGWVDGQISYLMGPGVWQMKSGVVEWSTAYKVAMLCTESTWVELGWVRVWL